MKKVYKKVYIVSPYRGDIKENTLNAKLFCKQAIDVGYIPIAPHLYFPQMLNDNDVIERAKGLEMGLELLKMCSEVWVYAGGEISEGMQCEIAYAKILGKKIKYFK